MPYITHKIKTQKELAPHGISVSHAEAFLEVANQFDCIIMTRSPGPYVLGLIKENYATKGYHNKAKSCNWGPMAGFVLTVPFFGKQALTAVRGEADQKKKIQGAIRAHCTQTALIISDTRINELVNNKVITTEPEAKNPRTGKTEIICKATMQEYGTNKAVQGTATLLKRAKKYQFILRELANRNANNDAPKYYQVFYKPTDSSANKIPVYALVDESLRVQGLDSKYPNKKKFPNIRYWMATTGDYDLFAVWKRFPRQLLNQARPPEYTQDVRADNRRPVSAMDVLSGNNLDQEYEDSGNSKDLIRIKVRPALNRAFKKAGYLGGKMVHHSDEAGRPKIDDIDFPVIAFLPQSTLGNLNIAYLYDINDFYEFYQEVKDKFLVDLNQGWIDQLLQLEKTRNQPQKAALAKDMSTRSVIGGD